MMIFKRMLLNKVFNKQSSLVVQKETLVCHNYVVLIMYSILFKIKYTKVHPPSSRKHCF